MGLFDKIFVDKEDMETSSDDEFYAMSESEALKEADKVGNKMILLEPRAFSEAQQIADHLKKRNSVVVNLKRVTSAQAKRIIDFLSGCIFASYITNKRIDFTFIVSWKTRTKFSHECHILLLP